MKFQSYFTPSLSLNIDINLFIRPHCDFSDILYNQPSNTYLSKKIESLLYHAALAIMVLSKTHPKKNYIKS